MTQVRATDHQIALVERHLRKHTEEELYDAGLAVISELQRWRELAHEFVEPTTPIRKINKQCGLCGFTKDTAIHEVEL